MHLTFGWVSDCEWQLRLTPKNYDARSSRSRTAGCRGEALHLVSQAYTIAREWSAARSKTPRDNTHGVDSLGVLSAHLIQH